MNGTERRSRGMSPFSMLIMLAVVVIGLLLFSAYSFWTMRSAFSDIHTRLASADQSLAKLREELSMGFQVTNEEDLQLKDMLYNEQKRVDELIDNIEGVDRTIGRLSGSVETLEKLTTTDPELLQKYSRVYFLNEHYTPTDLTAIDERYDLENGKQVTIHSEVWPFLKELLQDAARADVDLMVLSGYRSFTEQASLKQNYTFQYGTGANTFSADQGYSEHQLGTTVDFTTTEVGEDLDLFENTDAFDWLVQRAYRYGFVMSYPENNAYYQYEPWHWRFVGKELALEMHRDNEYFYDLEQREIDSYLPVLFDD